MMSYKTAAILLLSLNLLNFVKISYSEVACKFSDTVNITGFPRFPNGSYKYHDVLVPKEYTKVYDKIYLYKNEERKVPRHTRACICKLKNCIKMCSGPNTALFMDKYEEDLNSTENKIIIKNLNRVSILDLFAVQEGRPCKNLYELEQEIDAHTIFHNGSLLFDDTNILLSKEEYCLSSTTGVSESNGILSPHACADPQNEEKTELWKTIALVISVPFMLLTAGIYFIIPELRNIHGKSLVCYLLGMSVGYSFLAYMKSHDNLSQQFCQIGGFITYFLFISSFFWLNVISFHLWWKFRVIRGFNRKVENMRFRFYALYVYGLSTLFLGITMFAQLSDRVGYDFKPHIGTFDINEFNICWFDDKSGWNPMFYFFGPILIIIVINIILFILTSTTIYKEQKHMSKITARCENKKKFFKEKDRFTLYLRLFIVMGVTWLLEIFSYIAGNQFANIFWIIDICNAVQGFIIFILFVLKKKIKDLIIKNFKNIKMKGSTKTDSTMIGSDMPMIRCSYTKRSTCNETVLSEF